MAIIGDSDTVVTLTAAERNVTLDGTIDAYGAIGVYRFEIGGIVVRETVAAAVVGPGGEHFTIDNTGTVESAGTTAFDAGIVLGAAGSIVNGGEIYAGTGILLFGKSGHSKITNLGEIKGYFGEGVYAQNFVSIANSGGISGWQAGLLLAGGGAVDNKAGGLIGGRENFGVVALAAASIVNGGEIYGLNGFGAVRLEGGGVLDNQADISQFLQNTGYAAVGFYQGGTLRNSGSMYGGNGVKFLLPQGGAAAVYADNLGRITVYNFTDVLAASGAGFLDFGVGVYADAAGLVVNTSFISGNHAGIVFEDAAGTVQNSGYIVAGLGYGVDLAAGGTLSNGGTIEGYFVGVETGFASAASTISNSGLIESSKTAGSAPVGNRYDAGILAGGPVTVNNSGTIESGNIGVYLQGTGEVRNGGQIVGGLEGLYIKGAGGYGYNSGQIFAQIGMALGQGGELDNQGTISVSLNGMFFYKGGNFVNGGTIEAAGTYIGAAGIVLQAGGEGVNAGQISGAFGVISNGFAAVTNTSAGTITGTGIGGIYAGLLFNIGGGYLRNSGTIIGATTGIAAAGGGAVTVDNTGVIIGGAYAVSFAAGYADRLIIDAASTITGAIYGAEGMLEFAADGTAVGTFSTAMQTQFADFAAIQIDSGAIWDFSSTFTFAAATKLRNDGTIRESAHDTLSIDAALTGAGAVDLSRQGLTLNGSVASGQKIAFSGTNETLALGDPKAFHAKIEKFKLGDTIDLTSIALSAITATYFVENVLTIDEGAAKLKFTFANPSAFGDDTFALTAAGAGTAVTLSPAAAALFPVTQITTLATLPTFGS